MQKSKKVSKHAKFHGVVHKEWALLMESYDIDARMICEHFGLKREQASAMVKRPPSDMARLAMSAIYHRLRK